MPDRTGAPEHAELMSVGPDEVVVTFTTSTSDPVTTRVGDHELVTTGPFHVARITGLEPEVDYSLSVEGAEPDRWLPPLVRTLRRPSGNLVATIATANDVHFGEQECGRTGDPTADAIGPILRSGPGEEPYPTLMGKAAVAEIAALDPDVVVVKGDLTAMGLAEEYDEFLSVYGRLGDRMHHVRGNHDAIFDPTLARCDAPYVVALRGVTLAVLDTTVPQEVGGALPPDQIEWLDDVAGDSTVPVMVFAHHPAYDLATTLPVDERYVINRNDTIALIEAIDRNDSIVGFFAGHTHTNRVRRDNGREVPLVEVACGKDYPGAWAEYRVYEGGYTQVMRRISAPAALDWSERCRHMIQGIYRDLVLGSIEDRCFTQTF